jgi:hypothetical protein
VALVVQAGEAQDKSSMTLESICLSICLVLLSLVWHMRLALQAVLSEILILIKPSEHH